MASPKRIRKFLIVVMTIAVIGSVVLIARDAISRRPVRTTVATTVAATEATTTAATTTAATTTATATATTRMSTTATTEPAATTAATPWVTETRGTVAAEEAYQGYDNLSATWWFRRPQVTGEDEPSGIDAPVAELISAYDGIWRQDTDEKVIYLTMDEGYEYGDNTMRILDIAADKEIPITFFITGDFLRLSDSNGVPGTDLVARMVDEGHLVASHTWKHPELPALLDDEGVQAVVSQIRTLGDAFESQFSFPISHFLRPPAGAYSERTLKVLSDLGYRTVFWSFAYRDWVTDDQPDPAEALQQVVGELHPGGVFLLHAVSETNVEILPAFIDMARDRGYRFERLDNMP